MEGLRVLRVLQQGLQQSIVDGARDHVLAQPQNARSTDGQFSSISALSALTEPFTSIRISFPLTRNGQVAEPGFRLKVRHA